HHQADGQPREPLDQAQHGAPAADLDVVAVRAEAEHLERSVGRRGEREREHHAGPCVQTAQGGFPCEWRSSRSCRSLNVSIGTKKPSWRQVDSAEMSMSRSNGSCTSSSPGPRNSKIRWLMTKKPALIQTPARVTSSMRFTTP